MAPSIYNNIASVKSQQASVYTNQVFSKHSKSHNLSHNSSQNSDLYGNLSNGKRRRGNFVLKSRDSSQNSELDSIDLQSQTMYERQKKNVMLEAI